MILYDLLQNIQRSNSYIFHRTKSILLDHKSLGLFFEFNLSDKVDVHAVDAEEDI